MLLFGLRNFAPKLKEVLDEGWYIFYCAKSCAGMTTESLVTGIESIPKWKETVELTFRSLNQLKVWNSPDQ